nr:immunoglobulin heavy chain junction region [Mus musculus]
CPRDWEWFAYW